MSTETAEEESSVNRTVQRQGSHFEVENMEELESKVESPNGSTCSPGEVFTTVLRRPGKNVSFGFNIDGGSDRPYLDVDAGIYVTHITEGSITYKNGQIETGDKILEINGNPIIYESHQDVVNMITSCETTVKLTLHKNAGILLRSATLTEYSTDSGRSSPMQRKRNQRINKDKADFSMSGFVVGLAVGCVAVLVIRKFMMMNS